MQTTQSEKLLEYLSNWKSHRGLFVTHSYAHNRNISGTVHAVHLQLPSLIFFVPVSSWFQSACMVVGIRLEAKVRTWTLHTRGLSTEPIKLNVCRPIRSVGTIAMVRNYFGSQLVRCCTEPGGTAQTWTRDWLVVISSRRSPLHGILHHVVTKAWPLIRKP